MAKARHVHEHKRRSAFAIFFPKPTLGMILLLIYFIASLLVAKSPVM